MKYTIERGRDGKDVVLVHGEPVGVITRGSRGRGTHTCTIEGERTKGANGECRPGEQPAWLAKRARQAGLVGTPRRKPTIYEALREKLGREPTHNELVADVKRILNDSLVERATAGKLPHQRRRRR